MMKTFFRRALALLLSIVLLPVFSLAEETKQGYNFDLSFEMDASAYPEDAQEMAVGFADLMNMLTLSGTAVRQDDAFDVDFDMLLNRNEATRTAFRLYGLDSHWEIASSLFGDEKIMLNHKGILEFAMKAYFHLEMPLQYIALAVSPYAHRSAFTWIKPRWTGLLFAEEGTRTVRYNKVMNLANYIMENAEFKRAFYYWVSAIAMDIGYSEVFFESLYVLPDWVQTWLAEDGLQVTIEGDHEVWASGDVVLFERTGDDWLLTLPASLEGSVVTASCTREEGDITLCVDILSADEEALLDFDLVVNGLPAAFPFEGETTASLSLEGLMFAEPISLAARMTSDGEKVSVSQLNPETQMPMLTVNAAITTTQLPVPAYEASDLTGLNIFSVNDESLSAFVKSVFEPFMNGFLPILVELPASSYNSLFELLNQYGVLDLLTAGL